MAEQVPMQEMNESPVEQAFDAPPLEPQQLAQVQREQQAQQPAPQAPRPQQPQAERPAFRSAVGYFGPDEDRMDRAVADLDAALQQIGSNPTVEQILTVAQIQALISIAGELRSIRESGISQGDVL